MSERDDWDVAARFTVRAFSLYLLGWALFLAAVGTGAILIAIALRKAGVRPAVLGAATLVLVAAWGGVYAYREDVRNAPLTKYQREAVQELRDQYPIGFKMREWMDVAGMVFRLNLGFQERAILGQAELIRARRIEKITPFIWILGGIAAVIGVAFVWSVCKEGWR